MLHWIEYAAVRIVIAILQSLPLNACSTGASGLAFLCHDVLRLRRRIVHENLAAAFPQLSQRQRDTIALGMWAHLFLMVAEIAQAPRKIHRTNWREYSRVPQIRQLVSLLLAERPLIIASGHFGNFEIGGYVLGLFGFAPATVARTLDNPLLEAWIHSFRGATGQRMFPKEGSGQAIGEVLKENGIVVLLGDQAAGPRGCWINFLGRPASTHKAIGVMPRGADAPLIVTTVRRLQQPLSFELSLDGIMDPAEQPHPWTVPEYAQWYSDRLTDAILRDPGQNWWVHRRWKGTPPAKVKAVS